MLEDRQLLATITVNTTADDSSSDATLSLREAIKVSNGTLTVSSLSAQQQAQVSGPVGATNTIDFNIPKTDPGYNATTGVWTIALQSTLPTINKNAAIVDGYSQPGAAQNTLEQGDNAKLEIAINGAATGTNVGLEIDQAGSQVRGLAIENCAYAGVIVAAGGNAQVAGCFIGTDTTGETAAPNAVGVMIINSSNLIGGPNLGDRNVISGNSGGGLYVPVKGLNYLNIEPTGNQIENNYIGIDATGTKALANAGDGVDDHGSGDTYGGATAGLGNVVSGNRGSGIWAGGTITIEGNYVGTDATGNVAVANQGEEATASGGIVTEQDLSAPPVLSTVIMNNVVSGNATRGILVNGTYVTQATYTIANNLIGTNAAGTAALGNHGNGLEVVSLKNASILNNVISANDLGIRMAETVAVVQGNRIGTDTTGQVALGNSLGGINLYSSSGNLIGGTGAGQENVIADNDGPGIVVNFGQQNRLAQNSIFGNAGAGIELKDASQAVAAPVLNFTAGTGSSGTLSGTLTASPNQAYTIEIFSNPSVPEAGEEQGKTFIQDVMVNTDSSGNGTFSVTEPTGIYSATATDPNGNTSAFSNATESQGLPATTTTVSSSANPSMAGQQVTFTAIVTAAGVPETPTGTVTFTIDGDAQTPVPLSVVGGVDEAQFVTSTLTEGQHSVTAAYSGDTSVSPSSGSLPTQTVSASGLPATTTTLTSSANPSTSGQPVTFTAVVTAQGYQGTPTGTVTFAVDGQAEAPVPLALVGSSEQAQLTIATLSAGSHTVSASYSGDANVSSSAGSLPTETVTARGLGTTTTTLASSVNPSTAGQPVTFTAAVAPSGAAGSPSGSVTFTIDGVSQAPVPLHVVNGIDQATLSIASLAQGTHTIRAAYSGDSSFAASAEATPLVQTVKADPAPSGDGPTVESVKRYGIHMEPTVLVLSFNEPLDPSAVSLSDYKITGPTGRSDPIRSAVLNAEANTVTLRPQQRIDLHHTYHLTVIGTGPNGVRNTRGIHLEETSTGNPGGNYTCTVNWRNVVLTPAQVKKYLRPGQATPAGALTYRFLHSSR